MNSDSFDINGRVRIPNIYRVLHLWQMVPANLHVKMYDVLAMNELNSLTNLSHDTDASFLRQQEIFADRSIEQLTAVYTTAYTITLQHRPT